MSITPAEAHAESLVRENQVEGVPEFRIYSHSTIFYWWPAWVVGFIMAAITYADGSRAVIVPRDSVYDAAQHAVVLPAGSAQPESGDSVLGDRSAGSKNLGVVFSMEPTPMGPATVAVLDDTCGNLIQLAQV